jgi:polysaccharide biosynthesis transport protein
MLQAYKSPSVQVEEPASRDFSPAQPSPAELLSLAVGLVRRQFLVVLLVLPLTVGLAAIYLYITPPLYSAKASILIDTGKVQVFPKSILGDGPGGSPMVDSQVEILRSDTFALSVIRSLHLTQDPEFVASSGGLISSVSNLLLHPLSLIGQQASASVPDPKLRALGIFAKQLIVFRVGITYVIEIEFRSTDPNRAAQVANAVVNTFILDQLEAKYQTIQKATGWLQDRLNELRAQASAAERAVVEYKTKNSIVDSGSGHLINEQQLSDLNAALGKARADTMEAQARLDHISQALNTEELDPSGKQIATVADAMHNEIILKFRQQYLELAQREALLSKRLGNDHLAVINIRNQMREIRRSLLDEFKRIASAYQSEYDVAKARQSSLEKSLATNVAGSQTTNKAQIELRQLESAAQSYRALYDNFQQRYNDSVQQQSFPISEVRVIAEALPPPAPSYPKSFRVIAIATLGGLALGVGLGVLREFTDRVFRTSSQVEARLRTECVAMLPMLKPSAKAVSVADEIVPRTIPSNAGLHRYVIDSPLSRYAESIRAIKVSADFAGVVKSNKVIGITSSLPDEGKSTVSASFAQLCAHGGARVILVDCDLRKPSLSRDLAPRTSLGLIDVLTGTVNLNDVVWSDRSTKLAFLPVGDKTRLTHTAEILGSDRMKRLFDGLRESYDYVIVDLSPLAPVVDARSAAHLLDCYLFVVEWGKTKIDVAEHALNTARVVYENLLGVILNKVDYDRFARYDRNRTDYYYGSYFTRYGYTE